MASHKYSKKSNKELCKLCVTLKVPQVHRAMINPDKIHQKLSQSMLRFSAMGDVGKMCGF